jgi:phage terminase large subunit-like protein
MGLRGIGASPKRRALERRRGSSKKHPWTAPGLSRAERVIAFVESLPVTAGKFAGTNLKLRLWQRDFIRAVYRTDKAGERIVRTAVLSVGRKNGKTQLAAALALCALSGPEAEPRGECYSVACTRFQAGRVFSEMVAIIQKTRWLAERINIIRFRKELEDLDNGSVFAVLSADVAPVHGLNPSFICYDELAQAPSRALFDALATALGGREQPLMVVISTQAASETAPMSELVDYGLRIERGEISDDTYHLALFSAPMDADPWSLETWKLANPALGDFRSLDDVERLSRQAQRMPSSEASFRNLVLNQRVSVTQQFLTDSVWALGSAPVLAENLKGRPVWAGLDLAATVDLTALVLAFRDDDGGYDILPFCWLPGDTFEAEDRDRVPYATWVRQGFLERMPGKTTDPAIVARRIAELHGQFGIQGLAYDRWRISDLARELSTIGCDIELVPHGQGFRDMAPAVDVLERLAGEGKLRHGNHPVLRMCAGNARTVSDPAGNRKLDKSKSTGRIDALVALTMALGVASRHEVGEPWSPMLEVV